MAGKWQKRNKQAKRECRHHVAAADGPEPVVIQQVTEGRHEPLVMDAIPFDRELPKKSPWHAVLNPLQ
jgi:hypothetical protein